MKEQRKLTKELIEASNAYYTVGLSKMSDKEFDKKLEELRKMEKEYGIVLPGSPTVNVGTSTKVDKLKIVKHEMPALSLDKIKYKDDKKEEEKEPKKIDFYERYEKYEEWSEPQK